MLHTIVFGMIQSVNVKKRNDGRHVMEKSSNFISFANLPDFGLNRQP
jgi:hypothetical protein